jgi:hypothetical protein
VGLSLGAATALARDEGRVLVDCTGQEWLTMDYVATRLRVWCENNRVVRAQPGG